MKKEDVVAIWQAEVARLEAAKEPNVALQAWRGTRSRIHEKLQEQTPPPGPGKAHEEYDRLVAETSEKVVGGQDVTDHIAALVQHKVKLDKDHHEIQKAHFTLLWEQADKIVADAGITVEGRK